EASEDVPFFFLRPLSAGGADGGRGGRSVQLHGQSSSQRAGALVPLIGILAQATVDDRRQMLAGGGQRRGRLVALFAQDFAGAACGERRKAGERFVHQDSQRIDVGSRVRRLAPDALGGLIFRLGVLQAGGAADSVPIPKQRQPVVQQLGVEGLQSAAEIDV